MAALCAVSADALYSSGLSLQDSRTLKRLPQVVQINASAQRTVSIPGLLPLSLRLSVLNVLDRVNEIRSAEGIGIFQAAYATRRTVYGAASMHF
jgi:outer membrane receptor protein involved in Fe transport